MQIGKIKLQRKGGDGGRETANQLQFKINPLSIIKDGNKQIVLWKLFRHYEEDEW